MAILDGFMPIRWHGWSVALDARPRLALDKDTFGRIQIGSTCSEQEMEKVFFQEWRMLSQQGHLIIKEYLFGHLKYLEELGCIVR